MDANELRTITAEALGKDPDTVGDNPEWDSLDRLEIITHLHDLLGDKADDIDTFSDLESLTSILRSRGLVD